MQMTGESKGWMKAALLTTAAFYSLWAVWVLGWPAQSLGWAGLATAPAGAFLALWRFSGLVDLVLAGGLVAASVKPCQYWPVTSVGLALHSAATVGFAVSVHNGELPASCWPVVLIHDAIWCFPLAAVLHGVRCRDTERRASGCREVQSFALRTKTNYGVSLQEMSNLSPVLIVFLRQLACPLSMESVNGLAARRKEIEKHGVQIALVHMSKEPGADAVLAKCGLGDLPRVSDPNLSLYHAFGLRRASMVQFADPTVILRMLRAGAKYGFRKALGDSAQMPGVFFVFHGEVLRSYRHQSVADRVDLLALVSQQDYPIAS
jgi:peroxiredoxin